MFAIPPIAGTPNALALTPSILSAALPVNAVTTRQTVAAPSAPLSNGAIYDNAAGSAAGYQAQIIAQDQADSTVALATIYERVAPAVEYNVFASYSFIKYKPSDAGIPTQLSLPFPATKEEETPVSNKNDYYAYQNTQTRNQSALNLNAVLVAVAG